MASTKDSAMMVLSPAVGIVGGRMGARIVIVIVTATVLRLRRRRRWEKGGRRTPRAADGGFYRVSRFGGDSYGLLGRERGRGAVLVGKL